MTNLEYWTECVACAADECGLSLTDEQLKCLADGVNGGHENYSMAFGHDVANANWSATKQREITDLKKQVQREKDKVHCKTCNGKGRIYTYGGTMMSSMECWECHGEGRHDP